MNIAYEYNELKYLFYLLFLVYRLCLFETLIFVDICIFKNLLSKSLNGFEWKNEI